MLVVITIKKKNPQKTPQNKHTSQEIQMLVLPDPGPFTLGQVVSWTRDAKALCRNAK